MKFKERHERLSHVLEDSRLDALLVTNETNISYLSGFFGHDACILITAGRRYLITDSRYIEEARAGVKGFDVKLAKVSLYPVIKEIINKSRAKRVGFEAMHLPYAVAARLKGLFAGRMAPVKDMVESLRAVKDEEEIALIRRSAGITIRVLDKIVKSLRPGVPEDGVAKIAEMEFLKNGATPSFDPIVAGGANASKPHARPTREKIKKDSFVMVDIGCRLDNYCSDITRMVITGRAPDKFKKIYGIVRRAQELAISAICPGAKMAGLDAAARGYITRNGFGKFFSHSLGHGVGMEVHELPAIYRLSEGALRKGMTFTVEPAIYIPGFGGVRIEDMVLVTEKGCELLTR